VRDTHVSNQQSKKINKEQLKTKGINPDASIKIVWHVSSQNVIKWSFHSFSQAGIKLSGFGFGLALLRENQFS